MNIKQLVSDVESAIIAIQDQITFHGRTLKEWYRLTEIIIAPDATPVQIKTYLAEINNKLNLIEEAYQLLNYLKEVLKSKESVEFNAALNKLMEEGIEEKDGKHKKITRAKAEVLAEKIVAETSKSRAVTDALLLFFKGLKGKLNTTLNILNTMNIAEGYLQKQDRGGVY